MGLSNRTSPVVNLPSMCGCKAPLHNPSTFARIQLGNHGFFACKILRCGQEQLFVASSECMWSEDGGG